MEFNYSDEDIRQGAPALVQSTEPVPSTSTEFLGSDYDKFEIGRPESKDELAKMYNSAGCLGRRDEEYFEELFERDGTFSTGIKTYDSLGFSGYLRSYILESEEETTLCTATMWFNSFQDLFIPFSGIRRKSAILGLGFNLLEGRQREVDSLSVPGIPKKTPNFFPEFRLEEFQDQRMQFREKPQENDYNVWNKRKVIHKF